jgi:5-methylcytosine-specific restriction endonuclease McrA
MTLKAWTSVALVDGLKVRVRTERQLTSEIILFIQEIDRRRAYLEYGVPSLFAFLTEVIGYSRSAAQRRVEAARLSFDVPEIHESLKSGELNLSHLSLVAQGIKQKEKETSQKLSLNRRRELLDKIKSKSIETSEIIVAQELDLKIKPHEVCCRQKDESVRVEISFSKEEMTEIKRAQSLLSHQLFSPKYSELVMFLVRDTIKRKDPLQRAYRANPANQKSTPASVHTQHQNASTSSRPSRYIQTSKSTSVHERDKTCRWKDPKTQTVCDSTFQLQIDHINPLWAGGTNDFENLQLLCGVHNRLKYELESTTKFISDQSKPYMSNQSKFFMWDHRRPFVSNHTFMPDRRRLFVAV